MFANMEREHVLTRSRILTASPVERHCTLELRGPDAHVALQALPDVLARHLGARLDDRARDPTLTEEGVSGPTCFTRIRSRTRTGTS